MKISMMMREFHGKDKAVSKEGMPPRQMGCGGSGAAHPSRRGEESRRNIPPRKRTTQPRAVIRDGLLLV